MKNIGALLESQGLRYSNIIKTTIFVQDLGDFAAVNQVYASYFSGEYPARSCVQVAALPKGRTGGDRGHRRQGGLRVLPPQGVGKPGEILQRQLFRPDGRGKPRPFQSPQHRFL